MMFDYKMRLNAKQRALTKDQFQRMAQNHRRTSTGHLAPAEAHAPVVKYFAGGSCTWLLTEIDPETGIAFGLCDLGQGFPELGYVSIPELCSLATLGPWKWVERDLHFSSDKSITEWAEIAASRGLVGC